MCKDAAYVKESDRGVAKKRPGRPTLHERGALTRAELVTVVGRDAEGRVRVRGAGKLKRKELLEWAERLRDAGEL